jgi:cobalt-zinc-cadmium efflux system membrane fusion protein
MTAPRHPITFVALAALSVLGPPACRASVGGELDQTPLDEVWLSEDQLRKGEVREVTATETDVPQAVTAAGHVAFNDLHVTHVFSPVTGRVTTVLAQPGQRVRKGSPLLMLASPDVGQAFSDVVKAQADLAASEAEYHRQGRLSRAGATSRRDYEVAADGFRTSRAEYQRAEKKAALLGQGGLRSITQQYTLESYIDGEVIARTVNPGTEVQGQYSGGAAVELFTIGDIQEVWVYADVADVDLPQVAAGAGCEVRVPAYGERVFLGSVDWISGVVDPALRTARVRCAVSNRGEELKPEMLARVSIVRPSRRALTLPRDAVVHINESSFVYVADGSRPDGRRIFKRRVVRTAEARGERVAVLEGLAPGDRVVVEGSITREQPNDEVWPTPRQVAEAGITVEPVQRLDVRNAITMGARLAFDDLHVSHVFSPVSGRVTRVLAEPGQRVAKGTPLLAISSPDVGVALADVVKAEAALVAARHEYDRQRDLYSYAAPVRAGTLKDLETAESSWRKATAEVSRAREKARLLHVADLDGVTQEFLLRSPIAGQVIARAATPGLEIQGQYELQGNVLELFTVGSTDTLWVMGDVHESDRPRVSEGDQVELTVDAHPKEVFRGTVDWVSDVLDPVSHTAQLRCVVDNARHLLRPDMYEALRISLPGGPTVAIPRAALLRVGNETMVFVATRQRRPDGAVVFKRRRVHADEGVAGDVLPVSSGLQPGESLAVRHAVLLLGML